VDIAAITGNIEDIMLHGLFSIRISSIVIFIGIIVLQIMLLSSVEMNSIGEVISEISGGLFAMTWLCIVIGWSILKEFLKYLNPDSLKIVKGYVEPTLAEAKEGERFQFERMGYFVCDGSNVFNRTVSLKDSYKPQ
jgi:hypothetical protein